jgi:mono/diheme cytochrome c family protein
MRPGSPWHRAGATLPSVVLAMALLGVASAARPAQAADEVEPPGQVESGRRLYASHCSRCHGPNMVTPGTVAYDLRRFPADQQPRFALSVLGGRGAMPAWNGILDAAELDALWAYVVSRGR